MSDESTGGGFLNSLALMIGIAGFAAGCYGAFLGFSARKQIEEDAKYVQTVVEAVQGDAEMFEALGARVAVLEKPFGRGPDGAPVEIFAEIERLRRDVQEVAKHRSAVVAEERQLRDKVKELIARIEDSDDRAQALEDRLDGLLDRLRRGGGTLVPDGVAPSVAPNRGDKSRRGENLDPPK